MAHMFRDNAGDILFPEAVNLFSARSRFVREGSKSCMVSEILNREIDSIYVFVGLVV